MGKFVANKNEMSLYLKLLEIYLNKNSKKYNENSMFDLGIDNILFISRNYKISSFVFRDEFSKENYIRFKDTPFFPYVKIELKELVTDDLNLQDISDKINNTNIIDLKKLLFPDLNDNHYVITVRIVDVYTAYEHFIVWNIANHKIDKCFMTTNVDDVNSYIKINKFDYHVKLDVPRNLYSVNMLK